MLSELLREKQEYHRKTVTDSGVGEDVQADVSFESLNSLSRSRYQTCSIRFKFGVVWPSQAQTVITGGYAFYVFLNRFKFDRAKLS